MDTSFLKHFRNSSRKPRTPRCLIVDDDHIVHALLATFLSGEGFQMASARSVKEVTELAETFRPDVLLIDLEMPGMDGVEMARQIRAAYPRATPPVILAFTSLPESEALEFCSRAGMDGFLSKPFSQEALRRLLARWEFFEKHR